MMSQRVIESVMKRYRHNQEESFGTMMCSSVAVGCISTPGLVIFNGKTMGYSATESLRALSVIQAAAVITRETTFLFSLRISGPVSDMMKQSFGDNQIVALSSAFFTGVFGSVIGHAADTKLTWDQAKIFGQSYSHLKRGILIKAVATGSFTALYQTTKGMFEKSLK